MTGDGGAYASEVDDFVPAAIRTTGLCKRYRGRTVVRSIDLEVREGDRYGFLGPNGSGKTTTVRMLLGLVFPTSGRISVLGSPVPSRSRRALPEVGALVEGPAFYDGLSARANLALIDAAGPRGSGATRRSRIGEALERVGLASVGRKPVRAYSLGMRGRLGLAAAILRRPRLLILDEPTNGLDPHGIAEVRSLLIELNEADGTTIFLSSHLLSEIEQLCTRVGVLDEGHLVVQDDMTALAGPTGRVLVRTPDIGSLGAVLGGAVRERQGDRAVIEGFAPEEVATRLVQAGVRLGELIAEQRTLESVVLGATGAGADRVDRLPVVEGRHGRPLTSSTPEVPHSAEPREPAVDQVPRTEGAQPPTPEPETTESETTEPETTEPETTEPETTEPETTEPERLPQQSPAEPTTHPEPNARAADRPEAPGQRTPPRVHLGPPVPDDEDTPEEPASPPDSPNRET